MGQITGIRIGRWSARAVMAAVLVPFAAAGLVACSSDGDNSGSDLTRYCELTTELEDAADEAFGDLGPDATDEEINAAGVALVADTEDELDEIQTVAPDEIQDDVETIVAAQRAFADGDTEIVQTTEVVDAGDSLDEFDVENCTDE